jgi:hypothetical protein
MKSDKAKIVVEAGGAIAVLLGLVFVGLELRQNTEAVEAATFQALTDASSNYILSIASDPELNRIVTAGYADADTLNDPERARFFMVTRSYWVRMQNVYSQWQRGTLSDDDWLLYDNVICGSGEGLNSSHGLVQTFDEHRQLLTPGFVQFVERCWANQSSAAAGR